MHNIEQKAKKEDFSDIRKIRKSAKEDILDETFKKAEISKGLRSEPDDKVTKKHFLKLGIILIIIAVLSLIIINNLPWMYIKYNSDYGAVEELYYKDFINEEGHYYKEVDYIFESPCINCSNNSTNYIGLTKDDFSNIPKNASYGFITLAILGIVFTIIEVFRKRQNLSINTVTIIHSIFAAASLFIGIVVVLLSIKFIGFYFLLYYNKPFIEVSGIYNIILIFIVPIILIIISYAIIMISIIVMKINFNEFEKKLRSERSHLPYSTDRYGGKL